MLELKWGFAVRCTPHVHNTEDAILVPHPPSPCAEPLRQLCPCSCQLPARQQKAQGMGQCHEPMTFQPTHKATWRMRCLKSHFRFKEQHFHFSWKSPCALSQQPHEWQPWAGYSCTKLLPQPVMQTPPHSAAHSLRKQLLSVTPMITQCEVPLDRLRGCWSYLIPYQPGSIIGFAHHPEPQDVTKRPPGLVCWWWAQQRYSYVLLQWGLGTRMFSVYREIKIWAFKITWD